MLERYFARPSTIDRIRDTWIGPQIDRYVEWMEVNGYAKPTILRRVSQLCHFAKFAQGRGCMEVASAFDLIEEFVSEWLVQHGAETKTAVALRKHALDVGNGLRQMLRLVRDGRVMSNRHRRPFPLELLVPGFEEYLRDERGLRESSIHGYRHHLHVFGEHLRKAGISSFAELSPALVSSFIVDCAPGLAPTSRRDLCGQR